jgi:sulfatase modifying factor 1
MRALAALVATLAVVIATAPTSAGSDSALPNRSRVVTARELPRGMVIVAEGAATMGSTAEDVTHALEHARTEPGGAAVRDDEFDDELAPHPVQLETFAIDRLEVTAGEYDRCAERGLCVRRPIASGGERLRQADLPATLVTWTEASRYCEVVGGRLPTEAEWERAARGLAGRRYPWGNVFDKHRLNGGRLGLVPFDSADGFAELAPVGSFPSGATPSGVHDLAGNAEEWIADWYAPQYPDATEFNPRGPDQGDERVIRGGSYAHGGAWTRGAARSHDVPTARRAWRGFRCAYERSTR